MYKTEPDLALQLAAGLLLYLLFSQVFGSWTENPVTVVALSAIAAKIGTVLLLRSSVTSFLLPFVQEERRQPYVHSTISVGWGMTAGFTFAGSISAGIKIGLLTTLALLLLFKQFK